MATPSTGDRVGASLDRCARLASALAHEAGLREDGPIVGAPTGTVQEARGRAVDATSGKGPLNGAPSEVREERRPVGLPLRPPRAIAASAALVAVTGRPLPVATSVDGPSLGRCAFHPFAFFRVRDALKKHE